MSEHDHDIEQEGEVVTATEVTEPPMYKIFLLNDDFTPMEFVVDILIELFRKNEQEATQIMLTIHHEGVGLCGIFPREIAETKVAQVHQTARSHGHPLKCRMEPA
uniref:ATP-dependent Clp protease adapter protein ClpS n=1 Tax=Magnetococcus massalia (strain MO-1) TaxID=451514 RepID=A0A1S7LHR8_MAGMO|nr:ATP-dependent Clp protease adapter protein clpS [Candidatus Magnetococcus massalia]